MIHRWKAANRERIIDNNRRYYAANSDKKKKEYQKNRDDLILLCNSIDNIINIFIHEARKFAPTMTEKCFFSFLTTIVDKTYITEHDSDFLKEPEESFHEAVGVHEEDDEEPNGSAVDDTDVESEDNGEHAIQCSFDDCVLEAAKKNYRSDSSDSSTPPSPVKIQPKRVPAFCVTTIDADRAHTRSTLDDMGVGVESEDDGEDTIQSSSNDCVADATKKNYSSDSSDSSSPPSPVKIKPKRVRVRDSCIVTRAANSSVSADHEYRFPSLHSFIITGKDDYANSLKRSLISFVRMEMFPIHKFFHPILPLTNTCRMNYQSQQAIRVFYGENASPNNPSSRYVYGPLSVLKSTGSHPSNDYKVYPFTKELSDLSTSLFHLVSKKTNNSPRFNFLEVKIYIGDNMFQDEVGNRIQDINGVPLRLGCNKKVNAHNDLIFDDNGVQALSDTACGTQYTATMSIGSTRTLTFEHLTKSAGEQRWSNTVPRSNRTFHLNHGSVFALSPEDDKPTRIRRTLSLLHKTKHRVDFTGNGVSMAFVFRRVDKISTFDPVTHKWLWKSEAQNVREKVNHFLKKNELKYSSTEPSLCVGEMYKLSENMQNFILSLE